MRKIFVIIAFTIMILPVFCQKTYYDSLKTNFIYKNNVQFELGGYGGIYSVAYERTIFNRVKYKTTTQIGFSYYPPKTGLIAIFIPIVFNELVSFSKHHIEFGLGYIIAKDYLIKKADNVYNWEGFVTGRIGYRYQKPNGRIMLKIGFTPIIEYIHLENPIFYPSGGLALGYCF
jgi:hypothetical protein